MALSAIGMYGPDYLRRLAVMEEARKPQLDTEDRDARFIESAMADAIPNWGTGVRRIPMDGYPAGTDKKAFEVPTRESMEEFLDYDWTNEREYIIQKYDCEQFAFSLVSALGEKYAVNGIGIVIDWSSRHAYNIYVDPETRDVHLIEPQTDELMEVGEDEMHRLQRGLVLY